MSMEPGMTASFARARARGSQLGLATPVPWEKRGRTAPVNGDRCATKFDRNLSCGGRGTGPDRGEGEFSPGGPAITERDWWHYPLWLSAFPCCFRMFPPATGGGSRQQAEWNFFRVQRPISSHFVPSTPAYLERAEHVSRAGARHAKGEILHGEELIATNGGREEPER